MREFASDFPANSDTPGQVHGDALPESPLELEEWLDVLARAVLDVQLAQERFQGARAREAAHPSPWATAERRRAHEALGRARERHLFLSAVWDSGGRKHEVVSARFEHARERRNGGALVRVSAKRGRWRDIAVSAPTWRGIREWHIEHGSGAVPTRGPLFPGSEMDAPISLRTAQRWIHDVATRAGVQRVVRQGKRAPARHVTVRALRELAEAHVVYDLGFSAKLAAKVHDHTEEVQDRHYLRARSEAAARMAAARAHVHDA